MPLNGYLVDPFQNFSTQMRSSEHDFEGCTAKIGPLVWSVTFSFNNKTVDLFILSHLLMSTEKKKRFENVCRILTNVFQYFHADPTQDFILCQRARVIVKILTNMPRDANLAYKLLISLQCSRHT